ncbi:MAG: hypothetical protein M3014_06005, partial [Chloroflexota bacterium]|nr:hypothetical protein [Chloroflexota bacterium]
GLLGDKGLWWSGAGTGAGVAPLTNDLYYLNPVSLATGGPAKAVHLPKDKRVIAADPSTGRLVLAEPSVDSTGGTVLFMAGADGEDARIIWICPGEVYQASISPDGRWLLYQAQQDGASMQRSVGVVLLDAHANTASGGPLQSRELATLAWNGIRTDAHLGGIFLTTGGKVAQVLVSRVASGQEELTIFSLDDGHATQVAASSSLGQVRTDLSAIYHAGAYVVSRQAGAGIALVDLLDMRSRAHPASSPTTPLHADEGQMVRLQFTARDDYVVARVQSSSGENIGNQAVYAIVALDNTLGKPRLLATANRSGDPNMPTLTLSAGGSLLVYVNTAQELRAIPCAGGEEHLLAKGVKAVWSLKTRESSLWWR